MPETKPDIAILSKVDRDNCGPMLENLGEVESSAESWGTGYDDPLALHLDCNRTIIAELKDKAARRGATFISSPDLSDNGTVGMVVCRKGKATAYRVKPSENCVN